LSINQVHFEAIQRFVFLSYSADVGAAAKRHFSRFEKKKKIPFLIYKER